VTFSPNDFLSFVDTCGGANGGTCPPPTSFHIHGALGGPLVGYNWQFNQTWLAGIEADFSWSSIKGTGASNFTLGNFIAGGKASSFFADQNVKWFGTIRGRLGFVPINNILIYGTAGLPTLASMKTSYSIVSRGLVISLTLRSFVSPVPIASLAVRLALPRVGQAEVASNTRFRAILV
jgi:opacity protein-like surface antigen